MTKIITDLTLLALPCEPLEFLTEQGVDSEEGNKIITELLAVMDTCPETIALAAPQIGINKRIFCIRFNDTIKTFINPIITKKGSYRIAPETCRSMPNKEILISRPEELTVVYYTAEYKYEENKLLGAAARLFDQQCQLLDGITPDVLGLVSDIEEDGSLADLTPTEISELIQFYTEYVRAKSEAIQSQIASDSELASKFRTLNFAEKVINGQASVVIKDNEDRKQQAQAAAALSIKSAVVAEKAAKQANLKQFLKQKRK